MLSVKCYFPDARALRGLATTMHEDHELLDRGMGRVFDGLHAAMKRP
jgi:hypothetical protein